MYRIGSIAWNTGTQGTRKGWKAIRAAIMLLIAAGFAVVIAVGASVAPPFDWQVRLDARRYLTIHSGPTPACSNLANTLTSVPYTSQHDCARRGSQHPAFAIDYTTPYSARSLVWIRQSVR